MALSAIFVSIIAALIISSLLSLFKNIRSARLLGLPIIICPFNTRTIFWYLIGQHTIRRLFSFLPEPFGTWTKLTHVDWAFHDAGAMHRKLGPAFVIVHPGRYEVLLSDPAAALAVLNQRKDFIKPPEIYGILDIFGRNVDTVNGDEWARHRKITAPCFNETVSRSVWDEAIRQAKDMLASWVSEHEGITRTTIDDTRTLALHVLSAAGFGVRQEFKSGMRQIQAGNTLNYRDALVTILSNVVVAAALPLRILELPVLPAKLKTVSVALKEFKNQMNKMLQDNRQTFAKGQTSSRPNLLSTLIRCSDEERSPRERLTDDEILGNFFIFNVAGHDTTANTLAYAITLLSLNPNIQTWLAEELDHVIPDQPNGSEALPYEQAFPRLKRCLAVMYETLRLYGPVIYIPRKTQNSPTLKLSSAPGGEVQLPDDTYVTVNAHAIHTEPGFWTEPGRPALEFWPQRWIEAKNHIDDQIFIHREAGTWLGWSMGPRTCPGMKFSQASSPIVEFVAALSTLFAKHRVSPVVKPDKLREALAGSGIQGVTLCIKKKEDVVVKWQRVEQ
ncbi:cytochrome P450 [Saccharata proteae CBS 121410]|uniref:Cytochrome P450 n=1 Tax=Saccharata proteae CBS 121410 TaxID=1314787 RepID=A0A9P4HTX5_9PEZI|nr:cytochrome P450 [Saccharata proteae CBS 121410]